MNRTALFWFCFSLTGVDLWRLNWLQLPSSKSLSLPSSLSLLWYSSTTVAGPGQVATSSAHTVCPGRTITVRNACVTDDVTLLNIISKKVKIVYSYSSNTNYKNINILVRTRLKKKQIESESLLLTFDVQVKIILNIFILYWF